MKNQGLECVYYANNRIERERKSITSLSFAVYAKITSGRPHESLTQVTSRKGSQWSAHKSFGRYTLFIFWLLNQVNLLRIQTNKIATLESFNFTLPRSWQKNSSSLLGKINPIAYDTGNHIVIISLIYATVHKLTHPKVVFIKYVNMKTSTLKN